MRTYNYQLISTTGITGLISTSAHKIDYTWAYAMQAIYSGNTNGVLSLLSSNDGVNFDTIVGSSAAISGSSGSYLWNVLSANYLYVQGQFLASTASASTGTLRFIINSKGA